MKGTGINWGTVNLPHTWNVKDAAGLDITQVSYKGSSPVTLALLSNEVQVVLDAILDSAKGGNWAKVKEA